MIARRHVLAVFLVCLMSVGGMSTLWAQQTPAPPKPASDGLNGSDDRADVQAAPEGWALLERALNALARLDEDGARSALEALARAYPDHPATAISVEALAALQARAARADARSDDLGPDGQEEKTGAARAELVAFQTAHGIALGVELCVALECNNSRVVVSALIAGSGAGLGLSLLASRDGVTPGFATLINSGTLWGAYNGAMLAAVTDTDRSWAGIMAFSQLAGIGASAVIWNQLHPTVGEVSMANSGGIWIGALTLFGHMAADFSASEKVLLGSILAMSDLGIIAGALLSQHEPMSRGRTLVIDSGGVLGALVGAGTYVLIDSNFESATGVGISAIAGTLIGLGGAAYLSRNWDAPDDDSVSVRWGISPVEQGALLSLSGEF